METIRAKRISKKNNRIDLFVRDNFIKIFHKYAHVDGFWKNQRQLAISR